MLFKKKIINLEIKPRYKDESTEMYKIRKNVTIKIEDLLNTILNINHNKKIEVNKKNELIITLTNLLASASAKMIEEPELLISPENRTKNMFKKEEKISYIG